MDKEKFEKHIQESTSYSDASRKLYGNIFCGNRQVIKKYVRLYNINVDHFIDHGKSNGYNFKKRPLSEILKPNSYFSTTNLKNRLYANSLEDNAQINLFSLVFSILLSIYIKAKIINEKIKKSYYYVQ